MYPCTYTLYTELQPPAYFLLFVHVCRGPLVRHQALTQEQELLMQRCRALNQQIQVLEAALKKAGALLPRHTLASVSLSSYSPSSSVSTTGTLGEEELVLSTITFPAATQPAKPVSFSIIWLDNVQSTGACMVCVDRRGYQSTLQPPWQARHNRWKAPGCNFTARVMQPRRHTVKCHFEVKCCTAPGEKVLIIGDHPSLGSWDIGNGKALELQNTGSNVWEGDLGIEWEAWAYYNPKVMTFKV